MKDVLAHLAKLPPRCAAVVDGEVSFIRRGARAPDIAFIASDTIDRWNRDHGVTEAQVKAMIAGVTLGWDMDAADPDTHSASDEQLGDETFEYRYQTDISAEIVIKARSEQLAAHDAKLRAAEICDWLERSNPTPGIVRGYSPSDTLDLIETNDPRP